MGVSACELDVAVAAETTVAVQLAKEMATKCDRCWRYTKDVGEDALYPTVCLRCAEALTELQFPPYAGGRS